MKTVELYSLADRNATRYTIANAIGWNPYDLSLGQIDYLWNKEKVRMTDQYRSKQIIQKIKEQDIHFKIKRIFFMKFARENPRFQSWDERARNS